MEYQQILSQKYVEELRSGARNGQFLSLYENASFELDEVKLLVNPTILRPKRTALFLPGRESNYDFENAKLIFEAYQQLTPLQASDIRFWTYLAHADFYHYMRQRWPDMLTKSIEKRSDYILQHWFIASPTQDRLIRHGIAGLWWGAFLSYDETRSDPYSLTEQLFRQVDFRARTLGSYSLARHKEAVRGVLAFMVDNPSLFNRRLQEKSRFLTKYLNQLGGIRPVSYFDSQFFKDSLRAIEERISSI